MEVVFLLSAERDLQEAYNWVEEHRQGREQFFLQDVELSLEHIRGFPLIGRLYRGRYRRLLIPRYPHCVQLLPSVDFIGRILIDLKLAQRDTAKC
jgi:hypothetical protein